MYKKFLLCSTIVVVNLANSQILLPQSQVYFHYDEAGNQIFRGEGMLYITTPDEELMKDPKSSALITSPKKIDENEFWNNIQVHPVPVKDFLNIKWNEKVDDLISEIGLYEQSTVHWIFQNKKISSLKQEVKINMSSQYMGIYILTFTLKNGQRISKNITKL